MTKDGNGRRVVRVSAEEAGGTSPLLWFLVGGVVGAAVALLVAPGPGAETRRALGRRARRLSELTREKLAHLVEDEEDGDGQGGTAASGAWEDDEEGEWEEEAEGEEIDEEDVEEIDALEIEEERPKVSAARRELERRLARSRATHAARLADQSAGAEEDDEEPVA